MLAAPTSLAEACRLFSSDTAWLNTATYGLPPEPAWVAMQAAGEDWRHGRCGFEGWDESVAEARAAFARLVGGDPADVAVGPQVSPFTGIVAAALPAGARVVCPEEDFTSVLFPFLAQADRGVRVRTVPLDRLAEAIDARTDLVAFSVVQSSCGRVADVDAICAAAGHHGARTFADATQACGWLPLDATRFDFLVAGGYKWLLNPRGTAFFHVQPDAADGLVPHSAGWYAGEEPIEALYGPPLRLAGDARRFDVSPAWMSWVGAAPALALLEAVGVEAIQAHDLALADRFRAGLGLPPGDSAIVSVELAPDAGERLARAGVMAAGRDGRLRFSFHLSTSEDDVDRALAALGLP